MLRRVVVALAMAALASTATASPTATLTAPLTAVADDGTGAVVEGKLVLVLDSSGSMSEPADGADTKIDAAKRALTEVVDQLPDDAQVGLRVYGATVFDKSKSGACQDSQLVVPVGPLDRAALTSAIDDYEPFGETPIGYALQQAARDLGPDGKRRIVLLSDSEPTCAPDPCDVARQLHRQGVDLTIDVVGLDVDDRARRALSCIADAGGGTYVDARSAYDLAGSLVSTSVRALREFSVQGTPDSGTPTSREAPELAVGQYGRRQRPAAHLPDPPRSR